MAHLPRKKLWIIGGVSAVAIVAGAVYFAGTANNAGRFDQAIAEECAPLVAIAFRGSGETNLTPDELSNAGTEHRYGSSDLVTNGWEGATLRGLLDELSRTTYGEGFRADSIPVVPVGPAGESEPFGYDAIDAATEASSLDSALSFSKSSLLHSAARGAEAASHLMQSYLTNSVGCPILPKFVLLGYSQGAMAARHTAELNPESVLGVVTIGDPYQKPKGLGVRAGGADGTGLIRFKATEAQKSQLDAYYGLTDFTSSICHSGDPICEFEPIGGLWKLATGTYGDHMDYYTSAYPDEASTDAEVIARLGYEQMLRARAAAAAGDSVSGDETAGTGSLRALSLAYAGTPTLFSALPAGPSDGTLSYLFDLDGDGIFETPSSTGTAWVTFDEEGPHTVGVRVTNPATGETSDSRAEIGVAPAGDGVLTFNAAPAAAALSAPAAVTPGERLRVSVTGGIPLTAALLPLDGSPGGAAPVSLPAASGDWNTGILVPASVPLGAYRLVVVLEGESWLSASVTVVEAAPPAPPRAAPPRPVPPAPAPPVPPAPAPEVTEPPAPEPTLTFSDLPALPGDSVTATGIGFTPFSTVLLTVDGLQIEQQSDTDAHGGFVATLTIPGHALPGDYVLRVSDDGNDRDFGFSVDAAATDTPTIELSGVPVEAGRSFIVLGSGFAPEASVTFALDGTTAEFAPATAGADGTFTAELSIPGFVTPGIYVLSVFSDGEARDYELVVTPENEGT